MKPTIGRIVHYVSANSGEHFPAIISRIQGDVISLHVFEPAGTLAYRNVQQDAGGAYGTWHWPERE